MKYLKYSLNFDLKKTLHLGHFTLGLVSQPSKWSLNLKLFRSIEDSLKQICPMGHSVSQRYKTAYQDDFNSGGLLAKSPLTYYNPFMKINNYSGGNARKPVHAINIEGTGLPGETRGKYSGMPVPSRYVTPYAKYCPLPTNVPTENQPTT